MRRLLAACLVLPAATGCRAAPPPGPARGAAGQQVGAGPAPSGEPAASPVGEASAGPAGPSPRALASGALLIEAEALPPGGAWAAGRWGQNYYASTFANTFLSRKGFLGAPPQCAPSTASLSVSVPRAGRYLVLARYEAAHRFETRFQIRVDQGGAPRLDRAYGGLSSEKVWAFHAGIEKDHAWPWGASENIVWEGHDALVDLAAGPATLTLTAGPQPEPAARRNVDLIMLTPALDDVAARIKGEAYLPLDGLLTQEGDLYARLEVLPGGTPLSLTVPPGTEHSPYWVHHRTWKPLTLEASPGSPSPWLEVGSLLDTLNDGQWTLRAAPTSPGAPLAYRVSFAVPVVPAAPPAPPAPPALEPIGAFESTRPELRLAYDADTRITRKVHDADDALRGIVAALAASPAHGRPPRRALVFGLIAGRVKGDDAHDALVDTFVRLVGANGLFENMTRNLDPAPPPAGAAERGYLDLRDLPPEALEQACKRLRDEGLAPRVAVVSLGDEIALAAPPGDAHEAYRAFLKKRGLSPADVVSPHGNGAGGARSAARKPTWKDVRYTADPAERQRDPRAFYHASLFRYAFGAEQLKARTDVIRRYLPGAGVGANYSPHSTAYLGETHKWVSLFRAGAMTMPWSEDYAFQVPVGSQQMNSLGLDLFRAGIRHQPGARIHYYVMPHEPGNTPASFRRLFYADLMHGMKVVNLFELRPVQAAYTENYVNDPAMYLAIRDAVHELGALEDIVLPGAVRPAAAALWFSEAADVWGDDRPPFGAAKRTLYVALRHAELPLDVVVEPDALDGTLDRYEVLYLADRHVSRAATRAIAAWVKRGGRLLCTAGAGLRDELDEPNAAMGALLGIDEASLDAPASQQIRLEKQDLPFTDPIDTLAWKGEQLAVLGARSRFTPAASGASTLLASFGDGSPAVTERAAGKGSATYAGFLPGLSYFKPAIPLQPVDRSPRPGSMAHLVPTAFAAGARALLARPAEAVSRPVTSSEPLVESGTIEAPSGTLIPLVNWSGRRLEKLRVTVLAAAPRSATLASGRAVESAYEAGRQVLVLDLDEADAIVLR
jgi:hypothetical protein